MFRYFAYNVRKNNSIMLYKLRLEWALKITKKKLSLRIPKKMWLQIEELRLGSWWRWKKVLENESCFDVVRGVAVTRAERKREAEHGPGASECARERHIEIYSGLKLVQSMLMIFICTARTLNGSITATPHPPESQRPLALVSYATAAQPQRVVALIKMRWHFFVCQMCSHEAYVLFD